MTTPRLYNDLAHLWPLISPPEDYTAEAAVVRAIVEAHLPPADDLGGRRPAVLELGAGGGHTLVHLAERFDCTAVDLSEPMLANCRALIPSAEAVVGDMRDLRLGRAFDAVLLHDAVDYMTTPQDAAAAVRTAAAHLGPGGVFLLAPTYVAETFAEREVEVDQHGDDGRTVTTLSYISDADPGDGVFELLLVYVIDDGERVEVIEDRHTCGLFATEAWLAMMEAAGFDAAVHESDMPWTLLVGVKR